MLMKCSALVGMMVVAGCRTAAADKPVLKPVDPCGAQGLKLGTAKPLAAWKIPDNCTPKSISDKRILKTQKDLDEQFDCTKGAKVGVDSANQSIVAVSWNQSPAAIALDAWDDGKTITLVTRFRQNCPKDPRPMPMQTARWYAAPANADRAFAEATCTVPTKCN
jgi:hypothetical protein